MVNEVIKPVPLVPPHIPRDHPLVTRDYSLYTTPIQKMVDQMASWIDNQVEGATIYGPSRFGKSSDPVAFAKAIAGDVKARGAFIEMLWARQLEPLAVTRRWPNRASEFVPTYGALSIKTTQIDLHVRVGKTNFTGDAPMSRQGQRWVAQHATAIEVRQAWARASKQADKSIADGWADWTSDREYYETKAFEDCAVWLCRPKGKRIEFVAYVRQADKLPFLTPIPTKQDRCRARSEAHRKRMNLLEFLSKQPCLTWSQREGWQVEDGAPPEDGDVRRVNLMHTGIPTQCWIYKSRRIVEIANQYGH